MAWFSEESLKFLHDLEQNNDREWFHANKKRYEQHIKVPLEEFAAEMIARMSELDPHITMRPKDAISRINRDTRFSKDKAPYKTNVYLVVSSGGKKSFSTPGLYFNLGAETMYIGSGLYMLEPAEIAAVRRLLVSQPAKLQELLAQPAFASKFGGIQGERNKVLPAEFKEAAADQPLVANKQFYYWVEHASREALRDDLADWVMEHMRAAWPMNEFLVSALRAK